MDAYQTIQTFKGHLTDAKFRLMTYLEGDGYTFMVNNSRLMNDTAKWGNHDPVLIASADKARPRYLWAVKGAQ